MKRRRLASALGAGADTFSQIMMSMMQNNMIGQRQEQSQQAQTLRQMLQDFMTQSNTIATPENVEKYGVDPVQAQLEGLRRRLPRELQGFAGSAAPNLQAMRRPDATRLAPIGTQIQGAKSTEDVPADDAIRRMAQSLGIDLQQLDQSTVTTQPGMGGFPLVTGGDMRENPNISSLLSEAAGRRTSLEAAEPAEAVDYVDEAGTKRQKFLTNKQKRVAGPFQTDLSAQQAADRSGMVTTATKTAEEKVTNDLTNQRDRARGAGMEAGARKRAELAAELAQMGITGQQQQAALSLADDYEKASGDYFAVTKALRNVAQLARDETGQSDIGILYNVMHAFDPGAAVMEGDKATAQNTGSIPERMWRRYEQLRSGDQFLPSERDAWINTLKSMYTSTKADHDADVKTFTQRAAEMRVPPSLVIREPGAVDAGPPQPGQAGDALGKLRSRPARATGAGPRQ